MHTQYVFAIIFFFRPGSDLRWDFSRHDDVAFFCCETVRDPIDTINERVGKGKRVDKLEALNQQSDLRLDRSGPAKMSSSQTKLPVCPRGGRADHFSWTSGSTLLAVICR